MIEFEVINKKNERVINAKATNIATITFTKTGRITFTRTAAELCGLRIGKYLHFAILNKKTWLFYVNNDNSGYKLFSINNRSSAQVLIESVAIARLIKKEFGHSYPARYYVQATNHEQQGNKMFEILTHKPINEIGK